MVRWHHQINGHEFEQTLGDSDGQGSLVCHSPRGHKESDTTEHLNNNRISILWGPHPREKGAQISEQQQQNQVLNLGSLVPTSTLLSITAYCLSEE